MEGEELSPEDQSPLILIDATWRYAGVMQKQLPQLASCQRRRLPDGWWTAYPRCQTECLDPIRGLASIEAIYAAAVITGRPTEGLLDFYYWKDLFLEKNSFFAWERTRNMATNGLKGQDGSNRYFEKKWGFLWRWPVWVWCRWWWIRLYLNNRIQVTWFF